MKFLTTSEGNLQPSIEIPNESCQNGQAKRKHLHTCN